MRTCTICGKKGLFLKLNSMGMCPTCSSEHEQAEEMKRQVQYNQAKEFYHKLELLFHDIRDGIYFEKNISTIKEKLNLCNELESTLATYANYPDIAEIITSKIIYKNTMDEHLGLGYLDAFSIFIYKTDDIQQTFIKLRKSVQKAKKEWNTRIETIENNMKFQNVLLSLGTYTISTSSEKHKKLNLCDKPELKFSAISIKTNYEKLGTFIVVDTETTGLSAGKDEIIEVAAILFNNWIPITKFESLLKPKKEIPQEITKLTGISNEMVSDSPAFYEILDSLYDFIGNYNIVGHNLKFDMDFLYKNGLDTFSQKRKYYDTLDIARKTLKDMPNYKLVTLSDYYNIRDNSSAHRALSDCLTTGYLFSKLAYKRINP